MPRTHLLILALGVVLILLAGLAGGPQEEAPSMPATRGGDLPGEPDLIMEGAEISQFDATGDLAYRIIAATITHFPVTDHTLLETPRVTLYRDAAAPWEISARRGRIEGGGNLLDPGLMRAADPDAPDSLESSTEAGEIVVLEDDVIVRRQRRAGDFVALSTSRLDLFPGREYASTDRPVIIDTDSGRTMATGLRAELDTGRLLLGPSDTDRVRTTLFPDRLQ